MPRVIVKGGIWKNTEDEILKAAVGKYGLNQWARISSLLVRKTPKQCKARWYEWLDPGIKKTEWSKEEEEKLLHLAKLMPTQWRTIAPLVGRTPAQCLEHYEKLLDRAQGLDEEEKADDPRRLRQGEIDPNPETKPAKPDPVDMDEDEKEMLAEARARLANTQGKKAKRKAREKQLEEARRLATLQKRRELRAAGIDFRPQKKRKGFDYNAEIPFHKPVPAGFYSTAEEDQQAASASTFKRAWLADLEGPRRDAAEEEARKKDIERQKAREKEGLPPIPAQMLKISDELPFARSKLSLPAPQVGDSELAEIVKVGAANERAKAIVTEEASNTASDKLLFASASGATPLRPAATPVRPGMTPLLATPQIGLPRDELKSTRAELRAKLSALPKPKNEFEVVLPEEEEGDEKEAASEQSSMPEDAAEIAARKRAEEERAERIRLSLRPQAVQRELPRPSIVNVKMAATVEGAEADAALTEADDLIKKELVSMLQHDVVAYPVRGAAIKPGTQPPPQDEYTQDELLAAKTILLEETLEISSELPLEEFVRLHESISADFILFPSAGKFGRLSAVGKAERIASLQNELELRRANMAKQTKKAAKLAGKLDVVLGGYQTRATTLHKQVEEVIKQIDHASIELESFQGLAALERAGVETRIQALQGAITVQTAREAALQARYYELTVAKAS